MFFGYYEHSLDNKGRVVIPSKIRNECGDIIYIMKGFDGALSLYKKEAFLKIIENSDEYSFNKKVYRDYLRTLLSTATELEIDKQGRVLIPVQLLNKYKIGKDVVIIGVGDHFELWDKKAYEEYESQIDKEFEANAEQLNGN